jgi:predicted site-specific integrase-resolvase
MSDERKAPTPEEMLKTVERLRKEGKLPTLDEWLAAAAKARVKYQHQILAAREKGPEPGEEEEDEEWNEETAFYVRVSTDNQKTENQLEQLREFASKQGWTVTCSTVTWPRIQRATAISSRLCFWQPAKGSLTPCCSGPLTG